MTQTIEQLQAKVAELEEEKKELQALLDFDNARLDQIEDELEDVEYLGPYVEGIKVLKKQLAAAQEANEHWQRATAENENKWIEANDKLAKAEQRVAEACALQIATETKFHWLDAARVAKEIRSGEWRKFLKEV